MGLSMSEILAPGIIDGFSALFLVLLPFILYLTIPAMVFGILLRSEDASRVGGFLGVLLYFAIEHNQTFNLF